MPVPLKCFRRFFCALLCFLIGLSCTPLSCADGTITQPYLENLSLSVDGGEAKTLRALHYGYGNNRYVSLRDFAAALSGTPRHFDVHIANDEVYLTSGKDYALIGGEGTPFPDPSDGSVYTYATQPLRSCYLELDGRPLRYMTFLGLNSASWQDCFMSLTDLAMQLDLSIQVSASGMTLNTGAGFRIDLEALEKEGFYYEISSALVGDATTGIIYTAWEPMLEVPIASTTKLMSFIVLMDAIADGEISLDDRVTITEEAVQLSRTADGSIYMETGWEVSLMDLICGMLLPSSNECALALAIHTAGSENAFVERMNRKARALNLSEGAVFYNSNGLPVYMDNLAATKVQNRMSANDMFRLVCYLLRTYPEIMNITSLKYADLETLHTTVYNSNPLLFNLPDVVGLKTGTTNRSGSCLVAAMRVSDAEGNDHILVSAEFGAEDSTVRATLSEELLRYARQQLLSDSALLASPVKVIPSDAESLIRTILENY